MCVPNWLFFLCVLAFMATAWRLLPKWSLWARFEIPDRALAYLALFVGFALLSQQVTEYPHGVVYMLSGVGTRSTIDESLTHPQVVGMWRVIMTALYWLFVASALLSLVALFRGTKRDKGDDMEKLTNSIQALVDRIDKLLPPEEVIDDDNKPDTL